MSRPMRIVMIGLTFAAGLAGGFWLRLEGMRLPRNPTTQQKSFPADPGILFAVPDVRQSTSYSCGASALQAVLAYWGVETRENALMTVLKTNEESGTQPEEIVRVARDYGLNARMREGVGIADLRQAWQNGIPVIVAIQDWTDHPEVETHWEDDWEDGHYVIIIGVDDRYVYVEDPSLLGSRGMIAQGDFLKRWHDYAGDPPYDPKDRAYLHLAIFIEGSKKPGPVTFSDVH